VAEDTHTHDHDQVPQFIKYFQNSSLAEHDQLAHDHTSAMRHICHRTTTHWPHHYAVHPADT